MADEEGIKEFVFPQAFNRLKQVILRVDLLDPEIGRNSLKVLNLFKPL